MRLKSYAYRTLVQLTGYDHPLYADLERFKIANAFPFSESFCGREGKARGFCDPGPDSPKSHPKKRDPKWERKILISSL
jgi:hypothetical protein